MLPMTAIIAQLPRVTECGRTQKIKEHLVKLTKCLPNEQSVRKKKIAEHR